MNKYLMEVELFFSGKKEFEVLANDKKQSMILAKKYAERVWRGIYKTDSIRCIKKLRK